MKIAMLYPTFGGGLPTALESVFTDVLGECSFVHLGESDLLGEVIACNGLTRDLLSRLMGLYHAAVQAKAVSYTHLRESAAHRQSCETRGQIPAACLT